MLGVLVLLMLVLLECFLSTHDKDANINDAHRVSMTLEESNSKVQRSNNGDIHKGELLPFGKGKGVYLKRAIVYLSMNIRKHIRSRHQ